MEDTPLPNSRKLRHDGITLNGRCATTQFKETEAWWYNLKWKIHHYLIQGN
jgi:hypothetical protein